VTTTTIEERLAEVGRRIDLLQERAEANAAAAKPRIQRHVAAVREEEASAWASARDALDEVEEKLAQLETRLDVAEHSLAADVSGDRERFAAAVEAELHSWDTYLERMQTTAATKAWKAREHAEASISDVRMHRIAVGARLAQAREAAGESWQEQRERVAAARDELERRADELSAKLR